MSLLAHSGVESGRSSWRRFWKARLLKSEDSSSEILVRSMSFLLGTDEAMTLSWIERTCREEELKHQPAVIKKQVSGLHYVALMIYAPFSNDFGWVFSFKTKFPPLRFEVLATL